MRKTRQMQRVDTSGSLKMTGIWQTSIGYDPYKGAEEDEAASKMDAERAAGLLKLATMNAAGGESRGACKKCGSVGHLTMQCRNFISTTDKSAEAKDPEASDIDSDLEIPDDAELLEELREAKRQRKKKRRQGSDRGSGDEAPDAGSADDRERKRRKKDRKEKKRRKKEKKRRSRRERREPSDVSVSNSE